MDSNIFNSITWDEIQLDAEASRIIIKAAIKVNPLDSVLEP